MFDIHVNILIKGVQTYILYTKIYKVYLVSYPNR